MKIVLKVQW